MRALAAALSACLLGWPALAHEGAEVLYVPPDGEQVIAHERRAIRVRIEVDVPSESGAMWRHYLYLDAEGLDIRGTSEEPPQLFAALEPLPEPPVAGGAIAVGTLLSLRRRRAVV